VSDERKRDTDPIDTKPIEDRDTLPPSNDPIAYVKYELYSICRELTESLASTHAELTQAAEARELEDAAFREQWRAEQRRRAQEDDANWRVIQHSVQQINQATADTAKLAQTIDARTDALTRELGQIKDLVTAMDLRIAMQDKLPPNGLTGKCILVIDDYPEIQKVVRFALESRGATVVTAASWADAEEFVASIAFDCAIIDYKLPQVNGIECARRVREKHRACNLIIITGRSDDDIERECRELSAALLEKPFTFDKLVNAVKVSLGIEPDPTS
jgi:CheY-like chemotaxis protein